MRERGESGFTPHEARQARRLAIVIGLVAAFFVLELAGALVADSVVLQADAVHLLTDVFALGVSLLAMRLAVRAPSPRFTFGLRRVEPLAAVFGAGLVLLTTALIVAEGVVSLEGSASPRPGIMLVVAFGALVVNGVSAWLLHDAIGHGPTSVEPEESFSPAAGDREHAHDHRHATDHGPPHDGVRGRAKPHGHALNLRGAWLHLAGDTLGALAALAAAIFIRLGGDRRADPIASFVVAAILLVGSLRLLRDASMVLLEAAPAHLPSAVVRDAATNFAGVLAVRDLRVWTLGAGHDAIAVRVVGGADDAALGARLSDHLRTELGAEYVVVQVDRADG